MTDAMKPVTFGSDKMTLKPIEIAPKDGTHVLLYEYEHDFYVGFFMPAILNEPVAGWKPFSPCYGCHQPELSPTHWCELPEMPS